MVPKWRQMEPNGAQMESKRAQIGSRGDESEVYCPKLANSLGSRPERFAATPEAPGTRVSSIVAGDGGAGAWPLFCSPLYSATPFVTRVAKAPRSSLAKSGFVPTRWSETINWAMPRCSRGATFVDVSAPSAGPGAASGEAAAVARGSAVGVTVPSEVASLGQ